MKNNTQILSEEEKKEILKTVYGYSDDRYITPEEVKMLREMFPTPEKIKLLRKILNIFTKQEDGIVSPISELYAGKPEANRLAHEYGQTVLINDLADKKIRDSLANIYQVIKGSFEDEVRVEIEATQKELKDEADKQKANLEALKDEARPNLGENL